MVHTKRSQDRAWHLSTSVTLLRPISKDFNLLKLLTRDSFSVQMSIGSRTSQAGSLQSTIQKDARCRPNSKTVKIQSRATFATTQDPGKFSESTTSQSNSRCATWLI